MLVLTRKPGEKVVIGDNIVVTLLEIRGNRVRLAFEAPADVRILRQELVECHVASDPDLANRPAEWDEPCLVLER